MIGPANAKTKKRKRRGGGKHSRKRLPVGTIRLKKRERGEARYIKVRLDGPPSLRWQTLAKWTWEQHHGPVPKGMRVIHLDGNRLHDELSNYGLATGGELIQRLLKQRPEIARRMRERQAPAMADFNRSNARIRRLTRNWLPTRWYPVDMERRIIINDPCRVRWKALQRWGVAISRSDWRFAKRLLKDSAIQAVRGSRLSDAPFVAFDVEWEPASGGTP